MCSISIFFAFLGAFGRISRLGFSFSVPFATVNVTAIISTVKLHTPMAATDNGIVSAMSGRSYISLQQKYTTVGNMAIPKGIAGRLPTRLAARAYITYLPVICPFENPRAEKMPIWLRSSSTRRFIVVIHTSAATRKNSRGKTSPILPICEALLSNI